MTTALSGAPSRRHRRPFLHHRSFVRSARLALAASAAAALVLAAPLSASAHVKVAPDTAEPGSYAVLTFRVPTESATASTVKLEVDLPTDTPFTSVSYQPIPGWKATVTTSTLPKPVQTADATITEAPTRVVWTANKDAAIAPGQFQQFTITAGRVPDTGTVLLPAHQTYSDGTVVDWAQPPSSSGDEPEHPAPVLYINDTPPQAGQGSTGSATVTAAPAPSAGDATISAVAVGLGAGGVALGLLALAVALVAIVRLRGADRS